MRCARVNEPGKVSAVQELDSIRDSKGISKLPLIQLTYLI